MKKLFVIIHLAILFNTYSQSPNLINYQAVIRDANGALLSNQTKTIEISIIKSAVNGECVLTESHLVTSNQFGLITIAIGSLNTSDFEKINWAETNYFIKTRVDGYEMGTSQLLSVPYALYAKNAGNGFSGSYADLKDKPIGTKIGDIQYWNGTQWILLPAGETNQVLTVSSSKIPVWQNIKTLNPAFPPMVVLLNETNLQATSTKLNGIVNANIFLTEIQFEYGTTTNLGLSVTATQSPISGSSSSTISYTISSLQAKTTYFYRLKASNAIGTTLSAISSFTTLAKEPSVKEVSTISTTANSSVLKGYISANGDSCAVIFEYGLTSAYGDSIFALPYMVQTNSLVSSEIKNLKPASEYHFRIKAQNRFGTTYSNDETFSTLGEAPVTSTSTPTNITTTSANIKGNVKANNLTTTIQFEYGTDTNYGQTIDASPKLLDGNSTTSVNALISDLEEGTTYHYRLKTENIVGITYSNDEIFRTLGGIPIVKTNIAENISSGCATLQATVNPNYISSKVYFEYGLTENYGTLIETTNEITGNSDKKASCFVTALLPAKQYHYRVKAVNSHGTVYGNDTTFTTGQKPSLSKIFFNMSVATGTLIVTTDVNANFLSTTVTIEYGTTTAFENSIIASTTTKSNVTISINTLIPNLVVGEKYFFRVMAENALGKTYSETKEYIISNLKIGQPYLGGYIAFIDSTGEHGVIVAKNDQSSAIVWNNEANFETFVENESLGKGLINTNLIIAAQSDGVYAATICSNLVSESFEDWHLPSKDELNIIYTNLKLNNLGGLGTSYYWTSTESTASTAFTVNFSTGSISARNKSELSKVRAVRYF